MTDKPDDPITDSESFNLKNKFTENSTHNKNIKDVQIIVSLEYLSNFLRTLELPLITREVNLLLPLCKNCKIINTTTKVAILAQGNNREIPDAKICDHVINLTNKNSIKLWKQFGQGFKPFASWHRYNTKRYRVENRNELIYLIDLNFQNATFCASLQKTYR